MRTKLHARKALRPYSRKPLTTCKKGLKALLKKALKTLRIPNYMQERPLRPYSRKPFRHCAYQTTCFHTLIPGPE